MSSDNEDYIQELRDDLDSYRADTPHLPEMGDMKGIQQMLGGIMESLGNDQPIESIPQLARATHFSAGYDFVYDCLSAQEPINIMEPKDIQDKTRQDELYTYVDPGETIMINTHVRLNIPEGYYMQLVTKSRHALIGKHTDDIGRIVTQQGIMVLAGVIDADFKDEIRVLLHNYGTERYIIRYGDQIAQGILRKYETFDNELHPYKDAEFEHKGFGSTSTAASC